MVRWAILKGAKKVYAIDSVPARLAMAQKAGAEVVTINRDEEDVKKVIPEAVPKGLDGTSVSFICCLQADIIISRNRLYIIPRTQDLVAQD